MTQPLGKLLSGMEIPLIGLGTWKSKPSEVMNAVKVALGVGYRHIDCASIYGNEEEIGEALKKSFVEGVVRREEVFITSKLWNTKHRPADVRPALMKTLTDLQLQYLDLYLIHYPYSFKAGDDLFPRNEYGTIIYDYTPYVDTWEAMVKLVEEGLVRNIGMCNFNSKQVDEIISKSQLKPAVLQCECHPYLNQKNLISHVQKHGMLFQAYSPLGSADRPWAKETEPILMEDPRIIEVANKHGKSVAQVLINYQVDRGVAVLPKSVTPQRIKDNFVFDFQLSSEDKELLSSCDRGLRYCVPTIKVNGLDEPRDKAHPYFPYHESF